MLKLFERGDSSVWRVLEKGRTRDEQWKKDDEVLDVGACK